MTPDTHLVTRLLQDASAGNREAFDELVPLVYGELKKLAAGKLRMERAGHTLGATALVHEAYLRLVEQDRVEWQSRTHFYAVAARAMRRILINHAKGRKRVKRGGGAEHLSLDEARSSDPGALVSDGQAAELIALDEALERLEAFNPQGAEVVQYRFFGGLTHDEVAQVLGTTEKTVRRRWTAARAWLQTQLDPAVVERVQRSLAETDGDPDGDGSGQG